MLIPITSDFLPTNRYFLSNYGLENKKTGLHCDHYHIANRLIYWSYL